MDNDRELLEMAAKAAGWQVARWTDDDTALLLAGIQEPWNALHENPHSDCMGDALRLAVKLRISPVWSSFSVDALVVGRAHVTVMFTDEPDPYAATRRAIVRAAAAIGDAK
jgi:hypothetical protein